MLGQRRALSQGPRRLGRTGLAVAAAGTLALAAGAYLAVPGSEAAGERLTNADVRAIVAAALDRAAVEPSGLRVSPTGAARPTKMQIAVVDRTGKLLELHTTDDAWVGSIDIAKAKAYTAAAFSSDENALTSRSIGELSQPGKPLWQIGNSNRVGSRDENVEPRGLIEFPGGLPLYKNGRLVGGIGVSGDGVDQDENVAEAGACGYRPAPAIRIDTVSGGAVSYTAFAGFSCP